MWMARENGWQLATGFWQLATATSTADGGGERRSLVQ